MLLPLFRRPLRSIAILPFYMSLVASFAILRILLSDIGWLPVAGLLKPIVLIDLFMPQRTQENQPIDLAVRNNTTYHTADGIKISNMFG